MFILRRHSFKLLLDTEELSTLTIINGLYRALQKEPSFFSSFHIVTVKYNEKLIELQFFFLQLSRRPLTRGTTPAALPVTLG